jgi:Mrp family chromosome partitioning ATPase
MKHFLLYRTTIFGIKQSIPCLRWNRFQNQIFSSQIRSLGESSMSRRRIAEIEDELITSLGKINDPVLQTNLKMLGWLPKGISIEGTHVKVKVHIPTLLHPELQQLQRMLESAVESVLRSKELTFEMSLEASKPFPIHATSTDQHNDYLKTLGPALGNVSHCLAVYSCKGGVGKSTVAVNLAYDLARLGGRIGILDVDIYGPSLPILVKPDDATVRKSKKGSSMVIPIEHKGVKMLSLGYVNPESGVPGSGSIGGAAIMRGPMAARVVAQLLKGTEWGDLDILVIDLPPGTGDIQLAICQDLRLSGAVAVTTPSKLALSDAQKGIDMFTSLGVPTIAIVENMSYFVCEGGSKHFPFGKGSLANQIKSVYQLPISTITNDANDSGIPLALSRPTEAKEELDVMEKLASSVIRDLFLTQHLRTDSAEMTTHPHKITFPNSNVGDEFDLASTQLTIDGVSFVARFFSEQGALQVLIPPETLRARHPKTGDIVENEKSEMVQNVPKLFPAKLDPKGRYGYSVQWADGATIIYSLLSIARSAGAITKSPNQ